MLQQPRTYLILFILMSAVVNCTHFFSFSKQTPIDFRNLYLGSRIWVQGGNPYDDTVLKHEWAIVCKEEALEPETQPGLPQNFLVYPPYALMLYAPFALLSWHTAIVCNLILIVLCMVIMVRTIVDFIPVDCLPTSKQYWILAAVLLAFKGTAHAAIVGQPSFLCIAAAFLSFLSIQRKQTYPAVLWLMVASLKPTIALPVWILLMLHKEWKTLGLSIIGILILFGISLLPFNQIPDTLRSLMDNGNLLQSLLYQHHENYPLNYHMVSGTQLHILVEWITGNVSRYQQLISVMVLLTGTVFVYFKRNTTPLYYQFCVLISICLLATYHLFYDTMMLLPLVSLAGFNINRNTIIMFICALPLFIPVNGILDYLQIPASLNFLYFTLPISVLGIAAVLITAPFHHPLSSRGEQ